MTEYTGGNFFDFQMRRSHGQWFVRAGRTKRAVEMLTNVNKLKQRCRIQAINGVPALLHFFGVECPLFEFRNLRRQHAASSSSNVDEDDAVAPSRAGPDGSAPRFYKKASFSPGTDGNSWIVTLDNRILKTPAKKTLSVPTEALSLAIAAEWDWQEGRQIRPFTMPLMKLAATTIDQIPKDRERVILTLIKYFHCDSLLCRAPNSKLSDKQSIVWDPLLDWLANIIGSRPIPSSSLFIPNQPEAVVKGVEATLRELDDWKLSAVDSLAGVARSLTIALAVIHERITVAQAMEAIRLEENFQVEEWGFVEGGHDIDVADMEVRLMAASVFVRLLSVKS